MLQLLSTSCKTLRCRQHLLLLAACGGAQSAPAAAAAAAADNIQQARRKSWGLGGHKDGLTPWGQSAAEPAPAVSWAAAAVTRGLVLLG